MPVGRAGVHVRPPSADVVACRMRVPLSRSSSRIWPSHSRIPVGSSNSCVCPLATWIGADQLSPRSIERRTEQGTIVRHVAERQQKLTRGQLDRAAHAVAARVRGGVDRRAGLEGEAHRRPRCARKFARTARPGKRSGEIRHRARCEGADLGRLHEAGHQPRCRNKILDLSVIASWRVARWPTGFPFPRASGARRGRHRAFRGVIPGRAKRGEGDPGLSVIARSVSDEAIQTCRARRRVWIASLRSQ